MTEGLVSLALKAFRVLVRLLRDAQAAELGQRKQFATSGPNATDKSAGLGGGFWRLLGHGVRS